MQPDILEVMKSYAALEARVQAITNSLFGKICSLCTETCCTPNICEESLDSAFLREIRAAYQADAVFCDRYGWLTEHGCALVVGRPPVCYGFFCDDIINSLSAEEFSHVMIMGRAIAWVGARATGTRHLVEIMDSEELAKINCERILKRINIANNALDGVKAFFEHKDCSAEQAAAVKKVAR